MSGYSDSFAGYYDRFTVDVNYPSRARYFDTILQKYTDNPNLILDLACGTGSLSFELEKLGYDVIGVDGSYEMLNAATEKKADLDSNVLFLCQEMSELDLYGTVSGTICALDSLNHILDMNELSEVFRKVYLFSDPGAIFVFDVNTVYKHSVVLGDNIFIFEDKNTMCVWQNAYNKEDNSVDISLDFFEQTEDKGLWSRASESFSERAYTDEEIRELAKETGFKIVSVFDDDSFLPPRNDSERLIYVLKK